MRFNYFYTLLLFSFIGFSQSEVSLFGILKDEAQEDPIPFANVELFNENEELIEGTISDEDGKFIFEGLTKGNYTLKIAYLGFKDLSENIRVGELSQNLNLGNFFLKDDTESLDDVVVKANKENIAKNLEKKTYEIDENISQLGGSTLQAILNLPGITTNNQGEILLRGSNRVAVLIDGKQSAITGMGVQENLDNIPASSIERIEVINNPSSKYDSNAGAGIINIILKKESKDGWNAKVGVISGVGSVFQKKGNLVEDMRDQYRFTPKVNPSFSLNYRKDKFNFFANGDVLLYQEVSQNEFTTRNLPNSAESVQQQFLENKNQGVSNFRVGLDYEADDRNTFTFSTYYFRKQYKDLGNIPYVNIDSDERVRLWDYDERELVQIFTAEIKHKYDFEEPGHFIESSISYAFKRKEEDYFFSDLRENQFGSDTTAIVADQQIVDANVDYTKPLKTGKLEAGLKGRISQYPNEIIFNPGMNSILDLNLQGTAEYQENLGATYANYIYEDDKFALEAGGRLEYAKIDYLVDPNHPVYESDGFDYFEFLPSVRFNYRLNRKNRLALFFNRRVDRPEEKDLRVFPTYADPEILFLGNPGLQPQFTNSYELGYQLEFQEGSLYLATYRKDFENILTRIFTQTPNNQFVNVSQNAGRGSNSGVELNFDYRFTDWLKMNLNSNYYYNIINAFEITNAYPIDTDFSQEEQSNFTGNIKWNTQLKLPKEFSLQTTFTYLARDIIPQGEIKARYSFDLGIKKSVQEGKGEFFFNVSDLFNTFQLKTVRNDDDFNIVATDFFETQVFRLGYTYRF